jgi:ABC-type antimicrobial peptide transport system permease subunit
MAKVLWPGKDAIGQCMRVRADTMPCTTVVGIAEDMVQRDITNAQRFHYYLPIEQSQPSGGAYMLLKMRGNPALQMEPVRKALQAVMPGQSYVTVRPLFEAIDGARRSWRLGATMFMAFGVLALVVAAVGLYGVIGYNVTQRMHELGVRVALGAQSRDILTLVVGQGVRFAIAGIAVGIVLAAIASRWLQPLLFQQSARDPVIYAAVGAVLLFVAIVASASPAFRASRADPNTALRTE